MAQQDMAERAKAKLDRAKLGSAEREKVSGGSGDDAAAPLFPQLWSPPETEERKVLAELPSIDGAQWQLCLHPFSYRRDQNPDLSSLLGSAGKDGVAGETSEKATNVFFNPAFLAASRGRIARKTIYQLVAWENRDGEQVAHFSMPVIRHPASPLMPEHYHALVHPFAPLGTPLQSSLAQADLAARLADLFTAAFSNGFAPLLVEDVGAGTVFDRMAEGLQGTGGLGIGRANTGSRAGLIAASDQPRPGKKRQRELNRLLRKLGEVGTVDFELASSQFDVLLRFEEYLLIETRSWKGRRGTSIQAIKRHAAFARQAVCDLAREGRCQVLSMRLDGRPLASMILLSMNGCYYPWKITFDEHYARYSPGALLMARLGDYLHSLPDFRMADSLAKTGSSWMDLFWHDKIVLQNVAIAASTQRAEKLIRRAALPAKLRSMARKLLRR